MSLLQNTIFGKAKYIANTFIGGVAASLNTPALIAAKLGITSNRIKVFKIIGDDIEFAVIGGEYSPISVAFRSLPITYYDDRDGLITSLKFQIFRYNNNLSWVNFPNLTSLGDYNFESCGLNSNIVFPKLTSLSINCFGYLMNTCTLTFPMLTDLSLSNFVAPTVNTTINVPLALATSNSGKPSPYLTTPSITKTLVNYIGYVEDDTFNTQVGGLGPTFSSDRRELSLKLAIGSGGLFNLRNDSGILKFNAVANYGFSVSAFSGNSNITFYDDSIDGMVSNIANNAFMNSPIQWVKFYGLKKIILLNFGSNSFRNNPVLNSIEIPNLNEFNGSYWGRNCPNLVSVSFPELVKITNVAAFYADGNSIKDFYFPKLTQCGTNTAQESVFYLCKTNGTITVNAFLQTSNNGAPDGDLLYASNVRGTTIKYV